MKQCSKCNEIKYLQEFSRNPTSKTGYRSTCKKCDGKQKKNKREIKEGEKICATCGKLKQFNEFARNTTKSDNLNYECKICEKERRVERKAKEIDYSSFYLPI